MARRFGTARLLMAAGLLALCFGLAAVAHGQTKTKDAAKTVDRSRQIVPITTIDGVNLVGTYYPSQDPTGIRVSKESPCVILLHKFGSDRSKGDWDKLAKELQVKGYCVISFDFRGHGESRSVEPNFWKVGINNELVTKRPDKTRIDAVKDFKPGYLPWMVNDILAVRKFLEVKNDSAELNINSMFLIGAQEGASLGMLFTATEWIRQYTTGFTALQTAGVTHLGGQDIAGCVWLSLVQRPNNIHFDMNAWVRNTQPMRERTPFYLLYGERDRGAAQTAEGVFGILTGGRQKNRLTQKYDVKQTDLAGQALLGQPALGVDAKIIDFLEKVLADRKAIPWGVVDHDKNPLAIVPGLKQYGFSKMP